MADWDLPVVSETDNLHFSIGPTLEIPHLTDGYQFTQEIHREFIDEFINKLVRTERLKIFHNSNFGAFSDPDESREQFITRLGERAAKSIEDDLANLIRRVHMKLAQVREAQERKGRKLEIADTYLNNILMERRHELFMSQSRLEALFSSGERLLVTSSDGWSSVSPVDDPENRELHQTLRMIEEDTKRELNELCTQCIQRASECDLFYIGLQPNQIHILRQGVLWIPLE